MQLKLTQIEEKNTPNKGNKHERGGKISKWGKIMQLTQKNTVWSKLEKIYFMTEFKNV